MSISSLHRHWTYRVSITSSLSSVVPALSDGRSKLVRLEGLQSVDYLWRMSLYLEDGDICERSDFVFRSSPPPCLLYPSLTCSIQLSPETRPSSSFIPVSVSLGLIPSALASRLCDEGSAFWLGRLAIRSLLHHSDRLSSSPIHSKSPPPLLPLHRDLLTYFGTSDPMDIIELVSLTGSFVEGLSIGEAVAKRNAAVAGAARVVFSWAFPEDRQEVPPTPPDSPHDSIGFNLAALSRKEALTLSEKSIIPLIELTMSLLGDQSVVRPERTTLAMGGGLMMSKGYRRLLEEGLRGEGVRFAEERVVADAAGVGARGLAGVEFGA